MRLNRVENISNFRVFHLFASPSLMSQVWDRKLLAFQAKISSRSCTGRLARSAGAFGHFCGGEGIGLLRSAPIVESAVFQPVVVQLTGVCPGYVAGPEAKLEVVLGQPLGISWVTACRWHDHIDNYKVYRQAYCTRLRNTHPEMHFLPRLQMIPCPRRYHNR